KKRGAGQALEQYKSRYGGEVKTRGGDDEAAEILLRPLRQYRGEVESSDFILIQAQDISDKFGNLPVHMNATNVTDTIKPKGGKSVREVAENNLRQIEEQAEKTGKPVLQHLNHPNFGWGVTPEDVAEIPGEKFFEI